MKHALLLTWSPVADDPRVRRMGDTLTAAGWSVMGIGLDGGLSAPPQWPVTSVSAVGAQPRAALPFEQTLGQMAGKMLAPVAEALGRRNSSFATPFATVSQRLRESHAPISELAMQTAAKASRMIQQAGVSATDRYLEDYWRQSPHLRPMYDAAIEAAQSADCPMLVIANDWQTLPIAAQAAAMNGSVYVYDSHELAVEQFAQDLSWVRFTRPIIDAVEQKHIPGAAVTTAVSASIAKFLSQRYKLTTPAMVLRNTPTYRTINFRPSANEIRVLYQGVIAPGRGLEETIESVCMWEPHLSFHVRGPGHPSYIQKLEAHAALHQIQERVHFLPPVAVDDLIDAASQFDIGFLALPDLSLHKRYALPNKLFEYLMAGLLLAVSNLPEMARLVEETGAGVTYAGTSPDAIAVALNSISIEALNRQRRAALAAAKIHNWENEAPSVIAAYENALSYNKSA